MSEHDVVEEARPEILFQIRADTWIFDREVLGSVPKASAVDDAIIRHLQRGRHDKDGLGRLGKPVAGLTAHRSNSCETNRHIVDSGWSERGVEAIGDLHRRCGNDEYAIDERRSKEPLEPGTPIQAESYDEKDVDEANDHHHAEKRAKAPSPGPSCHGIEHIDDVLAAASGEYL